MASDVATTLLALAAPDGTVLEIIGPGARPGKSVD